MISAGTIEPVLRVLRIIDKVTIINPKSLFENPKRINKISNFCLYNVNTFAQYTADAIHI